MPSARFALVAGGHRGIVIVFCGEKWGAIQTVRCESEGYSGEEVEGLAAKAFGSDFALVHSDELADRNAQYFKRQGAHQCCGSSQNARRSQEV